MPHHFNVGRYAEASICTCVARASPPTSTCASCSHDVPRDLNGLNYEERLAYLETVPNGTLLTLFGYTMRTSPSHMRPSKIRELRQCGDALADAAIMSLPSNSADLYVAVEAAAARGDAAARALLDACALPAWADAARCARGGALFFENAPTFAVALLNLSLLGGFGAAAINETLVANRVLLGSRDRVHRRLIETLFFVLDVTGGSFARGERGFRAAVRVRLLHARVRQRVRAGGQHHGGGGAAAACPFRGGGGDAGGEEWDVSTKGMPINVADTLATQLAFSLVILLGVERAGLAWHISDTQSADFLHLWAVIGFLLGVPDVAAFNAFARAPVPAAAALLGARRTLESLVAYLAQPAASTRPLVLASIRAVAWRLPFCWSPADHVAVTSAFAGREYARALGMPSLLDAELSEKIHDASPSTSFSAELAHVECAQPSLAVDSPQRARAGATPGVLTRVLFRVAFWGARAFVWFAGVLAGDWARWWPRDGTDAAVARGVTLLRPLRAWPIVVYLIPASARGAFARTQQRALYAYVARRLSSDAPSE